MSIVTYKCPLCKARVSMITRECPNCLKRITPQAEILTPSNPEIELKSGKKVKSRYEFEFMMERSLMEDSPVKTKKSSSPDVGCFILVIVFSLILGFGRACSDTPDGPEIYERDQWDGHL